MEHIDMVFKFRRFLRRVNYAEGTINNRYYTVRKFVKWLDIPIEEVTSKTTYKYLGVLNNRRLKPKTINSYLDGIHRFYEYLFYEENIKIINPVKPSFKQLLPKPLPRFLQDKEIKILFDFIKSKRDIAMFMLMLRCGLRVEEVANLTLPAIDFRRRMILVLNGKFRKDRTVYFSDDTNDALKDYLKIRQPSRTRKIFLVEKGLYKGKPISVRGIQKRIEYYAKKTMLTVSCHRLRHTMATQLLNADAMLATVQELLGHECVVSTQRYAKVLNTKVRRDYFKAMELVMERYSN
jgi:site-specific recombinase XerD